jgi:23S rRNA (uracil1939-C5)-methyltransferase
MKPPRDSSSRPSDEGEILELQLTGQAYGGDAFGRDPSGRMVFVPFTLPGERARVRIVEAHERWARAALLEVSLPSPDRIVPRCRHFGSCGGCHYQHISYPAQLQAKREIVRSQLERLGGLTSPPVEPTIPSPNPWNARNHVEFSLSREGRLGFQAAGSHRVVPIEECHLPEPAIGEIWPQTDLEGIPGVSRVHFRVGSENDVMIVFEAETEPEIELLLELPASVVWLGPAGASVLAGSGHLMIEVAGRAFRVSAASFFQVHTALAIQLVEHALQALAPRGGETVFDLYAGVGLFSAFFAAAGTRVVAVEQSTAACSDFEFNLAEFDDVELYQASVEQVLPEIAAHADAVLLDPPRAGLEAAALDALLARAPKRIVYVSCDPATLARDGKRLTRGGYHLIRVTPFDLFPQTFHVETVSLWMRSGTHAVQSGP